MVTKGKALTNVYVWGVVGCALGILVSPALTPTSFSRVPALPGGVTYFVRGPGYALRLTQEPATVLIASPHDPTELIELQTDLPELEATLGEPRPAVLACELLFGRESLELDAKRAGLRSIQFRLDSGERPP